MNNLNNRKKYFAFSLPIERFFGFYDDVFVYWKDLNSIYYGCNDMMANWGKIPVTSVSGITDHEFGTLAEEVKKLHINDRFIIHNKVTCSYIEKCHFHLVPEELVFLSFKTSLYDSSNNVVGLFGISLVLRDGENFKKQSNLLNNFKIASLAPILIPPAVTKIGDTKLTKRETQCLYLLLKGKTSREIGQIWNRSIRTIQRHVENIKIKLSCRTKSELIGKVLEEGLFQ